MLRSKVVKSYDSEELDGILIGLQQRGCSISEVHSINSIKINMDPIKNLSFECNTFLILYDDPYVYEDTEKEDTSVPDKKTNEPDDEDLTNEQKFIRDWGRRPIHANVVGSLAYEYICPANTGLPIDQKAYSVETGLCSADQSACHECAKQFWKSKYKRPEKKEV